MKKFIIILSALALGCFFSGAALAAPYYDGNSSLMMTVYNPTSDSSAGPKEIGIHLTDIGTFDFAYSDIFVQVADNAFSTGDFGPAFEFSQLNAAIYGANAAGFGTYTAGKAFLFATDVNIKPIVSATASGLKDSTTGVALHYGTLAGGSSGPVSGLTSDSGSYWKQFNNNSAVGNMNGIITPRMNNEAELDALAQGTDIIMYLWASNTDRRAGALLQDTPIAKVKLTAGGDVFISTVPVPGAVWLLGSALLGVVGLRRKKA